MQKSLAISPVQSSGKVLFAQPQSLWPVNSIRSFYEQVLGLSWPIGGPSRIEVSPSLILRPASKGGFYILEKDGSWRCSCDGFYYKRTCRHCKAEQDREASQQPSELIQRGGFRPFLEI